MEVEITEEAMTVVNGNTVRKNKVSVVEVEVEVMIKNNVNIEREAVNLTVTDHLQNN